MLRTQQELEDIARKAFLSMPLDLKPSETIMVISLMLKGSAIVLKDRGN